MRPTCAGCARPVSVCLCDVIPSPPFNLRTRLLVLQHPHELKHKLATVPVLSRCVRPCHVVVGRRLHSSNWPFAPPSGDAAGHSTTLLLFPGLDATELRPWYDDAAANGGCFEARDALPRSMEMQVARNDSDENGHNHAPAEQIHESSRPGQILNTQAPSVQTITLVVLDGTWEHAQEMAKASLPFLLTRFGTQQVCLPFDVHSDGHGVGESDLIIRKEPFGGCVSTMEAVARALAVLELDGHVLELKLMAVLRKMVSLQASHFSLPKIRPKLTKKSKQCVPHPQ